MTSYPIVGFINKDDLDQLIKVCLELYKRLCRSKKVVINDNDTVQVLRNKYINAFRDELKITTYVDLPSTIKSTNYGMLENQLKEWMLFFHIYGVLEECGLFLVLCLGNDSVDNNTLKFISKEVFTHVTFVLWNKKMKYVFEKFAKSLFTTMLIINRENIFNFLSDCLFPTSENLKMVKNFNKIDVDRMIVFLDRIWKELLNKINENVSSPDTYTHTFYPFNDDQFPGTGRRLGTGGL